MQLAAEDSSCSTMNALAMVIVAVEAEPKFFITYTYVVATKALYQYKLWDVLHVLLLWIILETGGMPFTLGGPVQIRQDCKQV